MKTLLALFCVLFCVFFMSLVSAAIIPGGIAYSDGEGAVWFYVFNTGEKFNLTQDIKGAVVKGPFRVSENGKCLVWLQNNRLVAKELGKVGETYSIDNENVTEALKAGEAWTLKRNEPIYNTKYNIKTRKIVKYDYPGKDMPIADSIQNLVITPNGTKVAYETIGVNRGWIQLSVGDPSQALRSDPKTWVWYPKYTVRKDSCVFVDVLNVFGLNMFEEQQLGWANGLFGNVALYQPAKLPFITNPSVDGKVSSPIVTWYNRVPNIYSEASGNGIIGRLNVDSLFFADVLRKWTIKRNARFPAFSKPFSWEKGEKLIAVIYQTEVGWVSIDICDLDCQKSAFVSTENPKPGIYELPFATTSCEGLAWTPGGDLTVLSQGKLIKFNGEAIRAGIRNSSIGMDQGENVWNATHDIRPQTQILTNKNPPRRVGINNIFPIEPTLVAEKILGNQICWVTDTSFIFRGYDHSLYYWNQGNIEKLSDKISAYYSYCEHAPSAIADKQTGSMASANVPAVVPPENPSSPEVIPTPEPETIPNVRPEVIPTPAPQQAVDKKIAALSKKSGVMTAKAQKDLSIGALKFSWKPSVLKDGEIQSIVLSVASQEQFQYAITKEVSVDSVVDPLQGEYKNGGSDLEVVMGSVVRFKFKDQYVMIQPSAVNSAGWLSFKCKVWPSQTVRTAQR